MAIFATFKAQPFGLISSAGTGRVDRVNATIDAIAYFDLIKLFFSFRNKSIDMNRTAIVLE